MKLVTVEQMRLVEGETDRAGVSYLEMMENAGRGVAEAIQDRMEVGGRSIVILVGPGNNGGDGLVAGRYLAEAGAEPILYLYQGRSAEDPNFAKASQTGMQTILYEDDPSGQLISEAIGRADVIIDALLGTGVDRPLGGRMRDILERCALAITESRRRQPILRPRSITEAPLRGEGLPWVVAVDCPSGLDCDSGQLDPVALAANLTVTFAAPKVGHFCFPGAAALGELVVADIGSPGDLPAWDKVSLELATAESVGRILPSRPPDAHKGTFGKVMIIAGSVNYTGAAALAALGAYRTGAGLVTLAVPGSIHGSLAVSVPEATFLLLPHNMGAITAHGAPIVRKALEGYEALLVGPGLGRDDETAAFVSEFLTAGALATRGRIGFVTDRVGRTTAKDALPPMVVDADGLNLLAAMPNWPAALPGKTVLTPHPGEMERLLGVERRDAGRSRIEVAKEAAAEWGHIVLLKGAFTVVASPDGRTSVIPYANPALATAGSGDVLAGAVASLMGQGLDPYEASVAGGYLHGMAGQLSAAELGAAGVMAGDLPLFMAAALAELGLLAASTGRA